MTGSIDPNEDPGDRLEPMPPHPSAWDGATITLRQRQLLPLVCRGFSNREITALLAVGEDDVEYLVGELLGRTGSRNRTQLAAWAVEHHLGHSGIR